MTRSSSLATRLSSAPLSPPLRSSSTYTARQFAALASAFRKSSNASLILFWARFSPPMASVTTAANLSLIARTPRTNAAGGLAPPSWSRTRARPSARIRSPSASRRWFTELGTRLNRSYIRPRSAILSRSTGTASRPSPPAAAADAPAGLVATTRRTAAKPLPSMSTSVRAWRSMSSVSAIRRRAERVGVGRSRAWARRSSSARRDWAPRTYSMALYRPPDGPPMPPLAASESRPLDSTR
mmetsp:Transcript_17604/g.41060  ORF Transcript_17604/g.41060 Transcript_17604/m.41060 type:complete len:240 (-) Transcript_17604:1457-2176(-)